MIPALLLLPLCAPQPTIQDAVPGVRVELHASPIVDLWFQARSFAAVHQDLVDEHPFAGLTLAMKDYEAAFGSGRGWGMLEGNLLGCETAADVAAEFADIPVTTSIRLPGGKSRRVKVRELARAIAIELKRVEPSWLQTDAGSGGFEDVHYEAHAALCAPRLDRWSRIPAADRAALFENVLDWLGMEFETPPTVPVYLVANAPAPGAVTQRTFGGGAVCFVAVNGGPQGKAIFEEMVLHEVLHVLDVLSAQGSTLLSQIRDDLLAARIDARQPNYRHVPHTLFFLAAGEAVRRHLAPEHEDYGDASGYYTKVPDVIDVERELWQAYVRGELDRADLVERLVEAFAPGKKR